ncbi:MAG: MBOAT family O-acyltransferase [Christensenellales bacterium]
MLFNSIEFFVFFALICGLTASTNLNIIRRKFSQNSLCMFRNVCLLSFSYVFYGWWNWKCCFLMFGLSLVSFITANFFGKKHAKIYLLIGILVPVIILGIFKYYNFFIQSFCALFGIKEAVSLNIILPVGISFYTFQSISYTVDVYKGRIKAENNFIKVALYISFFPQLVAGPIERAKDFLPQLDEGRNINVQNFAEGIQIFVFGLFKKAVLADNLSVFVDEVFACPKEYHAVSIILAVLSYAIQIYCDFSGYSDMAIGSAKCLGYDLSKNFNLPYISRNISEFWKRWHITLSTWIKDYIYIPLGGNRKGTIRTLINLFLTMLIAGLWHGAAWTFVLWGALHGLALCLHRIIVFGKNKSSRKETGNIATENKFGCSEIISVILTNLFVCFCWIFFRASSFSNAWEIIGGIITWQNGVLQISSWCLFSVLCTVLGYVVAIARSKKKNEKLINGFYPKVKLSTFWGQFVFFLTVGLIVGIAYTGNNPFIYFQF